MMRLIYLIALGLVISPALAGSDDEDDEIASHEFALRVGHGVKIGDYRVELIEVQSVRDGLVDVRVWKRISEFEDWRVMQEFRDSNFDGGADRGGVTLTVVEIFDEDSVAMRAEYREDYGYPRSYVTEGAKAPKDLPDLSVEKSLDRDDISVGDEVKVTIAVKNVGNDTAEDVVILQEVPLSQFRYLAGYPPKIKNEFSPGESDFAVYSMVAVTEGDVVVPETVINYFDPGRNIYTAETSPFTITIKPKRRPNLELSTDPVGSIKHGDTITTNINVLNDGEASAYRVEIEGDIYPDDGIEIVEGTLDKTFFEIAPGSTETYSAAIKGKHSGTYAITLKASYQSDGETMQQEISFQAHVLEREYKYMYYVPVIPVLIIAAWVFRRYKEYKY